MPPVSLTEIEQARERIAGVVRVTPLLPAAGLPSPHATHLWLKAENLQRTGSFKLRGASNAIAALSPQEKARGVITYSSGNHGQGVACAAALQGIKAVIVMPEDAVPLKVANTRRWGAEVEFAGLTSLARMERALELIAQHGYTMIPPFDHPNIIAGQGTTGLEILEQMPQVEQVVVPVGGGGLISGIATALKTLRPEIRVVGAEPAGGADARDSLQQGEIVTWERIDTVADGLRTSRIGELNFATMRELVDEIVTVTDEVLLQTVANMANELKLVVEPSGAAAVAAVLGGQLGSPDKVTVAVVSGGNIDPALLASCLAPESAAV